MDVRCLACPSDHVLVLAPGRLHIFIPNQPEMNQAPISEY